MKGLTSKKELEITITQAMGSFSIVFKIALTMA